MPILTLNPLRFHTKLQTTNRLLRKQKNKQQTTPTTTTTIKTTTTNHTKIRRGIHSLTMYFTLRQILFLMMHVLRTKHTA